MAFAKLRGRRRVIVFVALSALALGSLLWFGASRYVLAARKPLQAPAVPVLLATVRQQDVADFLAGIGTVQASASVTVRAQVDGQLQKIDFVEGQDVRAGTVLARIDPSAIRAQYDQARAQKAKDQALLANARLDLQRYADLLQLDSVARQTYETQRAQVAQLEAVVDVDQAQLDYAKVQLARTEVTAPVSGRTGVRLVDVGNLVRAGDATGIVVVNQIDPITVLFSLPEDSLARVNRFMRGNDAKAMQVVALGRDGREPLAHGRLLVVNNQIDSASGTVQLKAAFANAEHKLWPGQFVNVRLILTTLKNALLLPASAVQRGPTGTFVYALRADRTVDIRPVHVASLQDGDAVIDDGVAAGEVVVAEGHSKLRPGVQVVGKSARADESRDGGPENSGRGPAG
jgi:RND family efflux transporter MFP subunit